MTEEEDFRQIFYDFCELETKRYRRIMTSNQDVMDAIAALPIAGIGTALTDLDTTVKTAISDMGTGGDAARAAMVTALGTAATGLGAVADQIVTIKTELTTAIGVVTPAPAAIKPAQ